MKKVSLYFSAAKLQHVFYMTKFWHMFFTFLGIIVPYMKMDLI